MVYAQVMKLVRFLKVLKNYFAKSYLINEWNIHSFIMLWFHSDDCCQPLEGSRTQPEWISEEGCSTRVTTVTGTRPTRQYRCGKGTRRDTRTLTWTCCVCKGFTRWSRNVYHLSGRTFPSCHYRNEKENSVFLFFNVAWYYWKYIIIIIKFNFLLFDRVLITKHSLIFGLKKSKLFGRFNYKKKVILYFCKYVKRSYFYQKSNNIIIIIAKFPEFFLKAPFHIFLKNLQSFFWRWEIWL